jgi:hypothetical protein
MALKMVPCVYQTRYCFIVWLDLCHTSFAMARVVFPWMWCGWTDSIFESFRCSSLPSVLPFLNSPYNDDESVHDDVQLCQWLRQRNGKLKLGDFNRAEIMEFNPETQQYCKYVNGVGWGNVSLETRLFISYHDSGSFHFTKHCSFSFIVVCVT